MPTSEGSLASTLPADPRPATTRLTALLLFRVTTLKIEEPLYRKVIAGDWRVQATFTLSILKSHYLPKLWYPIALFWRQVRRLLKQAGDALVDCSRLPGKSHQSKSEIIA